MKNKLSPLEVVKEIHMQVDVAGANCLAEANKILNAASPKITEFEELEQLAAKGFGSSKEVVEKRKELEMVALATKRARLISDYTVRYHQKFIPVEEMLKICKDYNLILGADKHYNETIPEKNRKEIIGFKLRKEDYIYHRGKLVIHKAGFEKSEGTLAWEEISEAEYIASTNGGKTLMVGTGRGQQHYQCNNNYFLIAAPQKMFNMEGVLVDGVELKQVIEVDDPIVLKSVRHGFLVVSVWGEEMAIDRMKNERNN